MLTEGEFFLEEIKREIWTAKAQLDEEIGNTKSEKFPVVSLVYI